MVIKYVSDPTPCTQVHCREIPIPLQVILIKIKTRHLTLLRRVCAKYNMSNLCHNTALNEDSLYLLEVLCA